MGRRSLAVVLTALPVASLMILIPGPASATSKVR
jgi:hypothetical protein